VTFRRRFLVVTYEVDDAVGPRFLAVEHADVFDAVQWNPHRYLRPPTAQ